MEMGVGGGAWGGSADFTASTPPYVFAFHMAIGVRLVGSAPSRFGAGGGGAGGGPRGRCRGMMARGSGRGSRGGVVALSGRSWCNGVVGLGRGQQEFCGVGKALVAGWEDECGRCAIALLGWWCIRLLLQPRDAA